MARVRNNAENLRNFATRFDNFLDCLYKKTLETKQSFGRLGESWQDAQYRRMGGKLDAFNSLIVRFVQSTETIPDDLRALAERIDNYNATR